MKFNKTIYYILSWTWGIIMTLIGFSVYVVLRCTGHKAEKHVESRYFNIGNSWGGVSFGPFFITDSRNYTPTKDHEFGHSLQNCVWGPLFPFVICIPSAIRWWLFKFKTRRKRNIFTAVLIFVLLVISATVMSVGIVLISTSIFITGALLAFYTEFILYWLVRKELPQHNKGAIEYDDIWFEGQASLWGYNVAGSYYRDET